MTDRDEKILRAAIALFSKFGVGKTTMGDIAVEAGVARQTVYNAFPSKPDILRATTRLAIKDFQMDVAEAWASSADLDGKIEAFFERGPLKWYDMITTAPESADLFEGINEHASVEVAQSEKEWIAMLAGMFRNEHLLSKDDAVTLEDAAEFFFVTSTNAKHGVSSLDQLKARLRTIKSALLNMLEGPSGPLT